MSGVNITEIDEKTIRFSLANGSLDVTIRNGDLSCESCDVLVNPTNVSMNPDGGLDSIMHGKMGQFFTDQVVAIHKEMQNNSCPHGQSRIFIAKFHRNENDPRYIINTVGPVYTEDDKNRASFLLQSCYYTSLCLANLYQVSSIAYPAISCGANQFPPNEAARIAIDSVRNFSLNVKDVRFVLHDPPLFKTFVQEWRDYANKINLEATATEQMNSLTNTIQQAPAPVSPKPSERYCVLCKGQQLSAVQRLICGNCSKLTRSMLFKQFLADLRQAAGESYAKLKSECEILKPILDHYPLNYTPAQKFDSSIHSRDAAAEHYLRTYCDTHFGNTMPMSIVGDGNCFYNAFIKLGSAGMTTDATSLTPIELRARNVVELVLNVDEYKSQYSGLESILDSFESYVRKEMVRDTNYACIWDFFSMATILNIQIISIYPKVNGNDDLYYHHINNLLYLPLATDNSVSKPNDATPPKEVKILFSHCHRPMVSASMKKKPWSPNHFVPLLNI